MIDMLIQLLKDIWCGLFDHGETDIEILKRNLPETCRRCQRVISTAASRSQR